MAREQDNGLLFAGNTFVRNRKIDGAGFVEIGNVTALSIASSSETKQRISKQKGSFGNALDSMVSPQPAEISFTGDTFDRHNLAMALMGQDSTLTQTAETVTDAPVAIAKQGQWYALGKTAIDAASVTVKTASDADVDSTAYQINADLGMILIKTGSSTVPDGSSIKVSFQTLAVSGFQIAAGTVDNFDLEIKVEGENRVTGKKGVLHIPSAVVGASSEIDWFSDDFAAAEFAGNVVKQGTAAPYTFTEFE